MESDDSDTELQRAFSRGDLKPGLNIELPKPEEHINNVTALEAKLKDIYMKLDWIERLDLSNDPAIAVPGETEVNASNADDDFKRELLFFRQAQASVLDALPRLRKLGIPTQRPEDYFAEMAKSDSHMKRVREKLLSKEIAMERSEKAKKIRELRKFGKKVQQNVTLQRQKEKREMLDSVKKFRKGQIDKLDFLDDDTDDGDRRHQKTKHKGGGKKRAFKDSKFGFGGIKKRSKKNTKESSGDDGDQSKSRRVGHQRKQTGKINKRPGKSRRQKIKANRR